MFLDSSMCGEEKNNVTLLVKTGLVTGRDEDPEDRCGGASPAPVFSFSTMRGGAPSTRCAIGSAERATPGGERSARGDPYAVGASGCPPFCAQVWRTVRSLTRSESFQRVRTVFGQREPVPFGPKHGRVDLQEVRDGQFAAQARADHRNATCGLVEFSRFRQLREVRSVAGDSRSDRVSIPFRSVRRHAVVARSVDTIVPIKGKKRRVTRHFCE